ncbi:aconitase X catalytic domain-containing protein, partial [Candidatus Bathyarchaeota archaeon]|nr:aconitase X catalytic domain-containing protein [Candidatus Bathyarchaeota archaeon]
MTRTEERMLDGDEGELLSKAMRLPVTLGETGGAKRLARIRRSQVAGVSYKTAGEPTLELLESFASTGTKVKTIATLNPAGMDLERWAQMGISAGFAEKQRRICRAYERLGIRPTCTCTPYLSGNRPAFGEIVGFSESSAVAYSNSVLGARSNRHGGLDALAAALVGRVPLMGYLLDENRLG